MNFERETLLRFLAVIAYSVPWLNPYAVGPSPSVMPWLLALLSAQLVMILAAFGTTAVLHAKPVAVGWLVAALISSTAGLIQIFDAANFFQPFVNTTAPGEAFANLRQRNQFASLTNIGLVALIWMAGPGRIQGGWLIASAALLAVGNSASSSRTGLLQLMMLMVLIAWWGGLKRPSTLRVMGVAALAYASASIVLPPLIGLEFGASGILGRINDSAAACSSRLILWRNVLDLIALKPWFGWGWGELDYAHFVTLYSGAPEARFCEILDNAHNLPLHLAVELGIPLALLVCGGGLWLIWRARPWLEKDATRQMAWGVLAVILLHSLLEYPLWYGPFQIAFGLCVWLLTGTPTQLETLFATNVVKNDVLANLGARYSEFRPIPPVIYTHAAILIIAFIGYAAWDYHRISQIYLAPSQRSEAYRTETLAKIQGSWLFRNQVQFAELTTTPVTAENASRINAMAHDVLHFSPEARVVEKLIDSAKLLGREDEARFYSVRYRAAYPEEYIRWTKVSGVR